MLNTRSLLAPGLALAASTALLLTGCATPADDAAPEGPHVLAALYPLQFLTAQVAGDLATVESITPQGAEPHDLELAPAQVRTIGEADLVVYIDGFQAALDDALAQRTPAHVIDAAAVLGLGSHDDDEHHDEEHAGDDEHHDHDHGTDPHFWLDPTLLAALAAPVADALATIDPDHAATYGSNATRIATELTDLDAELAGALTSCERDVVVVSHEAYGFLAARYGLTQLGLSGIDPEGEPSPARLREIREQIAEHDVTTIFTESLVNPKAAQVFAADLGLATALLDPIEAQVDPEADYRDVMRANLEALTLALGCA